MKRTLAWLLLVLAALAPQGTALAQQGPPSVERALAALPYLSSSVPEQRARAESIIEAAATRGFDRLVSELPRQPRQGREILLRILANTGHGGRIELCVGTLCRPDARRVERVIARAALDGVDPVRLLDMLAARLAEPALDDFARAQCLSLLGQSATARAQGVIEDRLREAPEDSLAAARLETALLRSILASAGAEPAWSRWQRRRPQAPRCTLRELQDALRGLARPTALERLQAESRVSALVGGDKRLLVALGGSSLPERASFALNALRRNVPEDLQLVVLDAMLELVSSAGPEAALLAIDVAVACAPPTPAELLRLRPLTSQDTISRLESILEGLRRGGNLADLRREHARVSAELRPLLQRRGAIDHETMARIRELQGVRQQLDAVEAQWRAGWRREFETEVLGVGGRQDR